MADTKPNFFVRIIDGIRRTVQETIGELRKVSWPTRQEAVKLTKVVLTVIFVTAAALGLLDYLWTLIFRLVIGS